MIVGHVIMLLGAVFMLLAAVGSVRMPDLMTRMHSTTKAGAFGAGMMLIGVTLEFSALDIQVRAIAILLFILLTTPVAAHAIGHAGYLSGAKMWEGTLKDELKDQLGAPPLSDAAAADATPSRPASEDSPTAR